jgi:hypothetical protein
MKVGNFYITRGDADFVFTRVNSTGTPRVQNRFKRKGRQHVLAACKSLQIYCC